jgi:hypothetical protein
VLSELEPVLSGHAETETETERRLGQGGSETTDGPNTTTPEETGTGPNTTTPNETGTGAETVPVERGTTVSWWLGVSYLPVILSADGPYLHGLGTHLALRFGPVLQLDLGADLVQPAAFETPDGHGELARWPLRAGLSAWWAFDTIEYGLGLGAVVEIWNVRRLDYEPADAGAMATRTNAGLTAVVRTRIKPLPWLAPLLDLGLDAYPTRVAVGVDSTELLHRPRIMLRLAIGVTAGGPKR